MYFSFSFYSFPFINFCLWVRHVLYYRNIYILFIGHAKLQRTLFGRRINPFIPDNIRDETRTAGGSLYNCVTAVFCYVIVYITIVTSKIFLLIQGLNYCRSLFYFVVTHNYL